jgi:hypothetical protein
MAITLSGTSGITLGANSALTFGDASTLPSATFQSIYPISASVAANAMTVTLNPCSIAFRSATLTSGTTSTATVSSAITVTIPSGATLGTVSNQLSDVTVVAINNAGTVELAVGIGSGDEFGVISTTSMSGTSNTIGTFYSTTGRSNVPYCVVGFVRSTQVTAGTWSTAPSLVQGFRNAPIGLGYGQSWQNLTSSRANGVTYYNTTARPLALAISAWASAGTGAVSINGAAIYNGLGRSTYFNTMPFCIIVPPGASYVTSGLDSIATWYELR